MKGAARPLTRAQVATCGAFLVRAHALRLRFALAASCEAADQALFDLDRLRADVAEWLLASGLPKATLRI